MGQQPVPLRKLRGIRLQASLIFNSNLKERGFNNYFRTFKNVSESTEDNHFYSSCFGQGSIISMGEHYGDRVNAMEHIIANLPEKYFVVDLRYDFRFAAVNQTYHTDGEFEYIKRLTENCLEDTGLYLFFMVSHFNQLVGKPLTQKPEHYHLIVAEQKEAHFNSSMYQQAATLFIKKLTSMQEINVSI